ELGRSGTGQMREMPRRLDYRHLHAKADPEIRDPAFAGKARRLDLALRAALAKTAGNEDAVYPLELPKRFRFGLEYLRIDPVEIDPAIVGDPAMRHRLSEGFVAVGK